MIFLDETFDYLKCMNETNSKTFMTNGNYHIHIIFMSNFNYGKGCQR
jgi:hypothetical protein